MAEQADPVPGPEVAGRGRASAVPARLAGWHGWTESQNESLRQAALRLDAAIDALNRSGSSPDVLGRLDRIGADVIRYVAANAATDAWVGAVGAALLDLARSRLPTDAARDAGNTGILAGGRVTTTDSRIAARVEPRTADLDARLLAARGLAERVEAALGSDDGPGLARALSEVQALARDPEPAAAFFARLGPGPALRAAAHEYAAAMLGPALAAATRADSWTGDFDAALLAGRTQATLALLAGGGVFGADFLAAAGDTWLLLGRDDDLTAGDHEVTAVLDALARDPDAALAFLLESSQADADDALPQSRLAEILLRYEDRLDPPGPVADALARLLVSAGTGPSAADPYGGPFGDQSQAGVLLFDLATLPGGMVPDALLPAVALILAGNLDALLTGRPGAWRERAVRLAVVDEAGRPHPERLALVIAGFGRWRAISAPSEYHPRTPANRRAWDRYLERAGTLAGLLCRVSEASFEALLGDPLRAELGVLGVPEAGTGPEVARAERAFGEAAGA